MLYKLVRLSSFNGEELNVVTTYASLDCGVLVLRCLKFCADNACLFIHMINV